MEEARNGAPARPLLYILSEGNDKLGQEEMQVVKKMRSCGASPRLGQSQRNSVSILPLPAMDLKDFLGGNWQLGLAGHAGLSAKSVCLRTSHKDHTKGWTSRAHSPLQEHEKLRIKKLETCI